MQPTRELSTPRLIAKRLAEDWALLLSVFIGIAAATTLAAGAPLYLGSLQQLAFNTGLDRLSSRFLDLGVFGSPIPLTRDSLDDAERSLMSAIDVHVSGAYASHETYFKTSSYVVGLPSRPLPEQAAGQRVSLGYFQYIANLEPHSRFVQGRMARNDPSTDPQAPLIEAVVSTRTAEDFRLALGHVVTLAPALRATRIRAQIVGVIEPADSREDFWHSAAVFLDPGPVSLSANTSPPVGLRLDSSEPPVALFVTREAMVGVVGKTYQGSLVSPIWFIHVDVEGLKAWSTAELGRRLQGFEDEITRLMPGASPSSGTLRGLADDVERKSFFSRVPLLLLMVMTAATALFYMAMVVSYLARSREGEVALLRTRGVGSVQIMRLYAMEGLVFSAVAVVLAPFLAFGLVALAGKLPYFRDMTAGGFLPVELGPGPFLWAGGAGALCMSIYVIAGAIGARSGLLVHKLRSSRPPTVPFFQRYYLDVALLALGGLVFWELHSRGHIVSGGLFKDMEVNETLLLAPVLFLVVVALVFIRMFPLLVRFISGESPALLHLAVVATLLALATAVAVRGLREDGGLGWLGPLALLLAVGVAYWATGRATRMGLRLAGIVAQAGLVGGFLALEPPVSGRPEFAPAIGLMSLVPAQVAFILLKASVRRAPAWISMGLWHMARNPLQYTWLVLLLVLVTGVGLLSTTVGGSLERSQEDRILYDVAADVRLSGLSTTRSGGARRLKEEYLAMPGVDSVSQGLRTAGSVGPTLVQVLALESDEVSNGSWYYRQDFSTLPLSGIMQALRPSVTVERVPFPEGASSIGAWIKPLGQFPVVSLWMVVEDGAGGMTTLSLGELGESEWHRISADIPPNLEPPLYLASIQFFEPGSGAAKTVGTVLLDDISATVGDTGEEVVLEDFEGAMRWTPLATSSLSPDAISYTDQDAKGGLSSGELSLGSGVRRSVRGFYQSIAGGPIPVVVSSSFLAATGFRVGDYIIAHIEGRPTPLIIQDSVTYFPTMSPAGAGFILADLDILLRYLNMEGARSKEEPNELFISGALDDETADGLARVAIRVEDRASRFESARLDPIATAGWRAVVLLSLALVVLVGVIGYVTDLLLFVRRSRTEIGFLQAMGLSDAQQVGLLGFEHLATALLGLGLGTWAGLQMSRLTVSRLAVTEAGEPPLPPLILLTDWTIMTPALAVLGVFFVAALAVLNRRLGQLDLHAIARMEGS